MIRRSIRKGWEIDADFKAKITERLKLIVECDDDDEKFFKVAQIVLDADKMNIDADKNDIAAERNRIAALDANRLAKEKGESSPVTVNLQIVEQVVTKSGPLEIIEEVVEARHNGNGHINGNGASLSNPEAIP